MKRVLWGRERRMQKAYPLDHKGEVCPDCGTPWKTLHDIPCEIEECPYCGKQLYGCEHRQRFWKGWKPKPESKRKVKKGFLSRLWYFGFGK